MRRLTSLLFALLVGLTAAAQSTLPTFSTEAAPVWYAIQFQTGSAYLSDNSGSTLITVSAASSDNAQFQFIGDKDAFKMKSKAGYWIASKSGSYITSSSSSGNAITMSIIDGNEDGYFEIQRNGSGLSFNQWGGTGTGKSIGEWSTGDTNNQLFFVLMSAILPTFSDSETEQYYFIQNLVGGRNFGLSTNGSDNAVRTYSADPIDAQLWKLVGTQDNFQLVNKTGVYAYMGSTTIDGGNGGDCPAPLMAGATQQEGGFALTEAPNTTNGTGFEISVNNVSGSQKYLNLWGGSAEGACLGLWLTNDVNNVVKFIRPEDMTYADYQSEGITGYTPEHDLTLWYDEPATTATLYSGGQGYSNWMEYALPIGDGQFGASLFGGMQKDEIQFNEKTLWSGKSTDHTADYGQYENFGSVYAEYIGTDFDYSSAGGAKDYLRQLDLTTATGKTQFTSQSGVTYTREYIASNPARVVAAHYTASESGKINLRFSMESGSVLKAATSYANGQGTFSGKLDVVSYNARFKVVATGGTTTTTAEGVEVRDADEVLLILGGGTDYDAYQTSYVSNTSQLASTIQARVNDAANSTWSELYAAHLADFQSFFSRVDFHLDGTSNTIPTNELVDTYNGGNGTNALMLEQLYFAYGRYLEIASSRGVDLPSNLQGIWSNMANPAWNSDIHSNINVQMNYWPAEPTNLSEMHVPFLNYIWNMAENHSEWAGWAEEQGESRGWTCFTENNIFGGVGSFMHNYVIANAWYATHLWQHYRYTLDRDFLKKVFPAMLSATQFWIDRVELASDGTYEAPNEYSPEHGPSSEDGVAHAQQLIYELFSNTLDAIDVLGSDASVTATDLAALKDRFGKLDKGLATETYSGNWGTSGLASGSTILREWKYSSYTAGDNGHRHMSHLMCVYPFSQVYPGTGLFDAAVNSMKLRGDGATGWSMGWKINLWARALDGDHARTILNNALAHSNGGAGVFYNLFDSHAPFQIDGNFGACAGMAEMLCQSNSDTIRVLPALPTAWKGGHVTGLKTVKDFTVDIAWSNHAATRITITNNQGQTIPVLYKDLAEATVYVNGVATTLAVDAKGVANLTGTAGTVYVFDFDGTYSPTGIDPATTGGLAIHVDGRQVSVSGKDVRQVRVIDLAGRTLQTSAKSFFSVSPTAGKALILEVTDAEGNVTTRKTLLQ